MEYEISELSDLANIPTEKLPEFFVDLEKWILGMKMVKKCNGPVVGASMWWIDDGKHDLSIEVSSIAKGDIAYIKNIPEFKEAMKAKGRAIEEALGHEVVRSKGGSDE
jgi:hypothetical protein